MIKCSALIASLLLDSVGFAQQRVTIATQTFYSPIGEWRPVSSYLQLWKNADGAIDSAKHIVPNSGMIRYSDFRHVTGHRSPNNFNQLELEYSGFQLKDRFAGKVEYFTFQGIDTVLQSIDSAEFIDSFLVRLDYEEVIHTWSYDEYGHGNTYVVFNPRPP